MTKIFYCTFNRSMELFYDGCFIEYDDGKVVGYIHDGILTGNVTSEIVETNKDTYTDFPLQEGYIVDRHQLEYDYNKGKIIITLYEKPYDCEIEEEILKRTWKRADKLPEDVQIALEKFLEAGEADT